MESHAVGRNIPFLTNLASVVMDGAHIKPYMCSPDGYHQEIFWEG